MKRWSWSARCSYPGRRPFIFGTVFTDTKEASEEARRLLQELLGEVFPVLPEVHAVLPGAVFFVPR
jgi:hypothetical protein